MVLKNMMASRIYLFGAVGGLLTLLGAAFFFSTASIVRYLVFEQLKMREGSETFKLWRDTPVPQTMSFYFFNWTNPEGLENEEKPILVQMGPYTFNIETKKTNITVNNNGTITFKIQRKWFFDPEKSNGTLDDEVTTLNSVAMTAAFSLRYKDLLLRKGLSMSLWTTGQQVYIRKTAGELLFFGYTDALLKMAAGLPSMAGVEKPPFDKFGWFYMRNGTDMFEGTFNMDQGIEDIYSFGKLRNWNFDSKTKFYPTPCGLINGSAGEMFPPGQTKETSLEMFSADLCRSIALSFAEEQTVHGVTGYRYVGDKYTFDNGSLGTGNECFCGGQCTPAGVLNVTSCRYGAPGFVSFPHYYLADPYYTEQVEGLSSNPDRHRLYITLEPTTGIPLDVAARFQINIRLAPVESISLFEDVPTIFFPMIWFEQRATITESLASQVRLVLYLPLIGQIASCLILFIGLSMVLMILYTVLKPPSDNICLDFKLNESVAEPLMIKTVPEPKFLPRIVQTVNSSST